MFQILESIQNKRVQLSVNSLIIIHSSPDFRFPWLFDFWSFNKLHDDTVRPPPKMLQLWYNFDVFIDKILSLACSRLDTVYPY